jgi:hypothetical protein
MKARLKTVLAAISASAALTTALLLATGVPASAAPPTAASTSGPPASAASAAASSGPSNPWLARSGLPRQAAERLQAEIDAQIAAYGGTQISPYEVAYNGGDVIMVFANPVTGELPTGSADRAETRQPADAAQPGAFAQLTPLTTSYRYGCPYTSTTGWTCFYQNINFNHYSCGGGGACGDGGRMLQINSCGNQSLATYGFSGETSSWVNNTDAYVTVYDGNNSLLWSESPGSASAYVGSVDNDKAASFWLIC